MNQREAESDMPFILGVDTLDIQHFAILYNSANVVALSVFILTCGVFMLVTTWGIPEVLQKPAPYFIKQRNKLSRMLNEQKKAFGQQNCQLAELQAVKNSMQVSANGGWCAKESTPGSIKHKLDEGFARALSAFLKDKHVGSFGDGPGAYKQYLDRLGDVASYTAYDGAPFCEITTNGLVSFLDLSGPQYGLPAFDWVTSVEVGEHIPQEFEDIYLDNLVRHAMEGVILSWAVPGQEGFSHVNNQPLEHVMEQMKRRGFLINTENGEPLRAASTYPWLQENVHVYYRANPESFASDDA